MEIKTFFVFELHNATKQKRMKQKVYITRLSVKNWFYNGNADTKSIILLSM